MGKTSIEWTDHSINPLRARLRGLDGDLQPIVNVGHYCEKTSPGCKNCYSSKFQPRFGMPTFQEQRRLDVEHWIDRSKLVDVMKRRKPTKWFWCDMTDLFGEWVPIESIALCFAAMAASPQHTHQVLTKRSKRMRDVVRELYTNDGEKIREAAESLAGDMSACHLGEDAWKWPLSSVWLGVSVEDEPRRRRIIDLLETPAAVRFVSAEPLLESLQLDVINLDDFSSLNLLTGEVSYSGRGGAPGHSSQRYRQGIDWLITGSESGNGARPMDEEWVRYLRDQCTAAGVSFFYKQKLEGKKKVGLPLLDGRTWDEFPEVRA